MQSPKTPDQQPFEYIKYAYIHVFNFKCVGFTSFKHFCPYFLVTPSSCYHVQQEHLLFHNIHKDESKRVILNNEAV